MRTLLILGNITFEENPNKAIIQEIEDVMLVDGIQKAQEIGYKGEIIWE